MANPVGAIRITRNPAALRDRRRSYKVFLYGRQAGVAQGGQTFVASVPPGTYRVRLKIDWAGSRELAVTVDAGSTASLICELAGSAWTASLDLLGRQPYISLRKE